MSVLAVHRTAIDINNVCLPMKAITKVDGLFFDFLAPQIGGACKISAQTPNLGQIWPEQCRTTLTTIAAAEQ